MRVQPLLEPARCQGSAVGPPDYGCPSLLSGPAYFRALLSERLSAIDLPAECCPARALRLEHLSANPTSRGSYPPVTPRPEKMMYLCIAGLAEPNDVRASIVRRIAVLVVPLRVLVPTTHFARYRCEFPLRSLATRRGRAQGIRRPVVQGAPGGRKRCSRRRRRCASRGARPRVCRRQRPRTVPAH